MPLRASAKVVSCLLALILVPALATSAAAEERRYDVAGFEEVSVATGIKATIAVGAAYSVVATSSANGLERLAVDVDGDVLTLRRHNRGMNWGRRDGVSVTISMPRLTALDASSGAHVTASRIEADGFVIEASSGAHIEAAGTCRTLDVDVSSGAAIDAKELLCDSVVADASSGARAKIFARENLSADASSGGQVIAFGDPDRVMQDTSSGGRIAFNRD